MRPAKLFAAVMSSSAASPPPTPDHLTTAPALLAILAVVLAGVIGVFVYALSPLGDPSVGTMPPPGSDRELIDDLVPALDDEVTLTRLLPATPPSERARLRDACGYLAGHNPDVTIIDSVTPSSFRVVLEGTVEPAVGLTCWIRFQWIDHEGWLAAPIGS